jgi:signal transduction histidine kinase
MLQGVDKNWEDAGTRRAAYYTSLTPGTYRFQVIACNNDGVWNQDGATLVFLVAPTWYQTLWFKSVVGITLLAICFFAYRLRVRQIAVSLGVRFDERLAERTRMARELHDTFLQTVQGSKMIVEDALQPGADTDRMRQALEKVFVWLTQAVGEGRAALHALRTSTMERNRISEALQRAAEDPQIPSSMTVSMTTVGDPHDLHPIVRDEIYRIAFEAIHNAALHSKASRLQIELRYANDVCVRVSDNGVGMDPAVADHGEDGHFGLQGMRERATRIHGKLSIRSSVGSGTEVTVSVPWTIVYRTTPLGFLQRIRDRLRRLFR